MGESPFLFIGNHLALDFINTEMIIKSERTDLLGDFGDLLSWFVEAAVLTQSQANSIRNTLPRDVGTSWLQRARVLRTEVRGMVEQLTEHKPIPESAIKAINSSMSERPGYFQVVKTKGGFEQRFLSIVEAQECLLAPIGEAAGHLLSKVPRTLIKKCANDACILYFFDGSKNHARTWCSMQLCGNRMKVAAFFERQRRHTTK